MKKFTENIQSINESKLDVIKNLKSKYEDAIDKINSEYGGKFDKLIYNILNAYLDSKMGITPEEDDEDFYDPEWEIDGESFLINVLSGFGTSIHISGNKYVEFISIDTNEGSWTVGGEIYDPDRNMDLGTFAERITELTTEEKSNLLDQLDNLSITDSLINKYSGNAMKKVNKQ